MADGPLPLSFLVVLAVSSFALPLVFLGWIRNTERLSREPWFAVLRSFAWGAVFSVLVAILLSLLLLSLLLDVAPLPELLSWRSARPRASGSPRQRTSSTVWRSSPSRVLPRPSS